MKNLLTLIRMQFKNKIDLSFIASKKTLLRSSVWFLVKFTILTVIDFFLLTLLESLGIFYYSEAPKIMILMMFISLTLSLFSCTAGLMKSLYFSDDNKVLITFPVPGNYIFISKLIVYFFYEIKRGFSFIIPITLSCVILLVNNGLCMPVVFIWMWIPLVLVIAIPVLLGGLLSIPVLYIYTFIKKHSILEILIAVIVLGLTIIGTVYLIKLIPENVDLVQEWRNISRFIRDFLTAVESYLTPIAQIVYSMIGEKVNVSYVFSFWTLIKFGLLIVIIAILSVLLFFTSRPLFFKMMVKSGELSKNNIRAGKNVRRNHYLTFVNKELKITLRSSEIAINYLLVYIILPILILLVNSIYGAMDTNLRGDLLIVTTNILLICLPLLASNALVATYYSREGHSGYLKKTKPIYAIYPLLSKLVLNIVCSIPAVFVSVSIFGTNYGLSIVKIVILGFAILILHFAHMLWSAMLDIMNPQNEQYQTVGVEVSNPNEDRSTILAFIISFIYALFAFKLFSESTQFAPLKLLILSLIVLIAITILFVKRVRAYYYDK